MKTRRINLNLFEGRGGPGGTEFYRLVRDYQIRGLGLVEDLVSYMLALEWLDHGDYAVVVQYQKEERGTTYLGVLGLYSGYNRALLAFEGWMARVERELPDGWAAADTALRGRLIGALGDAGYPAVDLAEPP